jgi:hypothetical protein
MTEQKTMEFINQFKDQLCIFQHRFKPNHRVWDCAMQVNFKFEQLIIQNRCRICWQEGHNGMNCPNKVTFHCDSCGSKYHFQPLCYSYVQKAAETRKLSREARESEERKAAQTIQQADVKPTLSEPQDIKPSVSQLKLNLDQVYNQLKSQAAHRKKQQVTNNATASHLVQSASTSSIVTEEPREISAVAV